MARCWGRIALGFVAALLLAGGSAQAAPPVEAYGRLPAIEMIRLSPSGERVAFVIQDHGKRRMLVRSMSGQTLGTGDVGDAKLRDLKWAGEDHVLARVTATVNLGMEWGFKHELEAVWVMPLNGHKSFQVFQNRPGIGQSVFGSYGEVQSGGRWYGYFGGITLERGMAEFQLTHSFPDLYQVDLDTGEPRKVAQGSEDSDDWLVGADGKVLARSYYTDRTGAWKITDSTGKVLLSGVSPLGGVALISQGRTPGTVLVEEPGEDDNIYLEVPLAGGTPVAIPNGEFISRWITDPATGLWIGSTADSDEGETTFFDPRVEAKMRGTRKAFPKLRVQLVSHGADFNRMIVHTDGEGDSGTYWLVDIPKGSADVVGEDYPEIKEADVGPIRMVSWKAADGLELRGVLTLPPGREAKNLPLVVLPHGGPAARDYPGFDWWAQAFAGRGYAVFQPNFRGSDGYGGKFRKAGWGEWGRKMQTDVSDGVAALAAQGLVDPKRACVVGGSYGGYVALAGVTLQHGLYRCAVSVAGVADLDGMLSYNGEERGRASAAVRYWRNYTGAKTGFSSGLRDISPARLADKADAPILLIHGKDDTVVPIEQSREMEGALNSAGKPVEFVLMPDEDHWLSREATRTLMLTSAVAFVEKHNPPETRPATSPAR
jgi:dipeptidyl aminopeptidase/acylaminoacyl peptidase